MSAFDVLVTQVQRIAGEWKAEADRRKKFTTVDPVADTLEYMADELLEQVREVSADNYWQSVEDKARDLGVSPQTIRNWIRKGELEALDTPQGYQIPRHAVRRKSA